MTEQSRRNSHPYGSVRDAVIEWIAEFPAGEEFHYGDIATDLGVQLPTVSASILKLVRSENSLVVRGTKAGWYKRVDPDAKPEAAPAPEPAGPEEIKPDDLLEVVGKYKNGNILLRWPNDGSLWEAKAL